MDFMQAFSVTFNNYLILLNKDTHIIENIHNFTILDRGSSSCLSRHFEGKNRILIFKEYET